MSAICSTDAGVTALLRLADDHLILGHRLSEWCGHAPMLEEDLALPNIALDLIGQARNLYGLAGLREGAGRDEDALAFLRPERQFLNLLLVERPNGDFAHTILRQFWFSALMVLTWERAETGTDPEIAAIAAKAVKEARYHLRHTGEWVIRLGDGTGESHRRMVAAQAALLPYRDEMFATDAVAQAMAESGALPDPAALRDAWHALTAPVFAEATLPDPGPHPVLTGGRAGRHTEDMGPLLAQMQVMQRSYPGLTW